ncbi:hypothetical protein ACTXT7_016633 [Hymenolepis weldensis]
MLSTSEMALISQNDHDQTLSILIGKFIGRSLQCRNITFAEALETPSEDYEEVDVIAMPASTGTEAIISKQKNDDQDSVKA